MDPATLAVLVQIAARAIDTAIARADAREAAGALAAARRLAATQARIAAIRFGTLDTGEAP